MTRFLALLALLLGLAAGAARAQDGAEGFIGPPAPPPGFTDRIDYEAWDRTAARAAQISEAGRGSDFALERLRTDLVEWRDRFAAGQSTNSARIGTVMAQIDALGPPPGEGDPSAGVPADPPESDAVRQRREELLGQLARLRAPAVLAEEAYAHADGLISELDGLIRARQVARLAERGPSPLDPDNWHEAVSEVGTRLGSVRAELSAAWKSGARREAFWDALPAAALFGVAGVLLLAFGRRLSRRLWQRVTPGQGYGPGVWRLMVSLGEILLPMIGAFCLATGFDATGLAGYRSNQLIIALPAAAFFVIFARWLSGQFFSPEAPMHAPLDFTPDRRQRAHWLLVGLGWTLAAGTLWVALLDTGDTSASAMAVLTFPFQIVSGVLLFRFGLLLARPDASATTEASVPYRLVLMIFVGRLAMLAALLAPLLAAAGYGAAQEALLLPAILTIGLIGGVIVLQRLVHDVYGLITRDETAGRDGLAPVVIGFLVAVLAVPALALIWGARVDDLAELWTRFRAGYALGETRISPTDFMAFVAIFAAGYLLTRLLQATLRSTVLPKTRLDLGGRNAIVAGLGYFGIFVSAMLAIVGAGIDLSSFAIVAGALSVGIGFGLQNIVSNFVSGIILLIERPISEGDWIEVGGQMGYVRDISVRSTRIETFDRTDVIVPNADLVSGQVTNWTRGNSVGRVIVPVGVAYGTDPAQVEAILTEVAEASTMVILNPPPAVLFMGFGPDSLNFEIRAILRDVNFTLSVRSEMNHLIVRRFAEAGIRIPFPQRDVWLRNGEVPEIMPDRPGDAAGAVPAAPRPDAPEEDPR